ncbi:MAG: hypothetical protein M3Y40_07915 [Chloroflexota bacterium]|jgi:hypothetical protein|nr:hypothetical protein [Chloroflexota bacterium]
MHPVTAMFVSQALADEHRRSAERRRRDERQRRISGKAPRRQMAWPFRLLRPRAAGTGA